MSVKGLWNEFKDPDTGESSLKEHTLKVVWTSCKPDEHYFELTDSPKREVTCANCGFSQTFILGIQNLKDGKLIDLKRKL